MKTIWSKIKNKFKRKNKDSQSIHYDSIDKNRLTSFLDIKPDPDKKEITMRENASQLKETLYESVLLAGASYYLIKNLIIESGNNFLNQLFKKNKKKKTPIKFKTVSEIKKITTQKKDSKLN